MTKDEIQEKINTNNVVVLKCGASWCSPCKTMEPIIESVAQRFEGKAVVISVDVDEEPDIATQYRVRNIPTILYFKGGELTAKSVGAMSENELVGKINKLLGEEN